MRRTESTWARWRNARLAGAGSGLLLAVLALALPAHSVLGRVFLLASLAITALLVLVLARRPGHRPNAIEIVLPLATLGIVALSALHLLH